MRAVVVAALIGCTQTAPTPTGAACPSPDPMTLTWDSFGHDFMGRYCINCHASTLPASQRNGAPLFHDVDTLINVLEIADHVDQWAGFGPNAHNTLMPGEGTGGRCPSTLGGPLDMDCLMPTAEERTNLSIWLACEQQRLMAPR
jgi:hypothetical protein